MLFRLSSISIMVITIGLLCATSAKAQYVEANEIFTAGQAVNVSVPQADTLIITYRPGSNIAEVQKVAVSGNTYKWTPKEAGLVSLATPGGPAQTVSVSFGGFPVQGLIVLIIAGSILFGGALYASVNLFGKASPEAITDRPDT
ncbi:MAG TPA: hypothetical protein VF181_03530 [Balneolaceae bacterium]